jgi:hypothetical protein
MEPLATGLLPSPPDARDYKFATATQVGGTPPASLDLRPFVKPPRNQGPHGTCAAFACSAMREWQERNDNGYDAYFSPQFVYVHRENQSSEGMYLRDVMKILAKIGICPEHMCEYESVQTKDKVDPQALAAASKCVVAAYATVNSAEEARLAMHTKGPVLFAFPVWNTGPTFWKKTQSTDTFKGYHAVAGVGYDAVRGICIRNSWGTGWADGGYTWYPWADWGAHSECWSSVDAPSPEKPPAPPGVTCGCFGE